MAYPPQGTRDPDAITRDKISNETWEMLLAANNTKRVRKVLRRILKGTSEQNEED